MARQKKEIIEYPEETAPAVNQRKRIDSPSFSIRRGPFALMILLGGIGITASQETAGAESAVLIAASLGVMGIAQEMRLRSIGYPGWFILLTLVPGVNIVLHQRLLAYPAAYATTKKGDTAMRVISWSYYGIFLAMLVLGILVSIHRK